MTEIFGNARSPATVWLEKVYIDLSEVTKESMKTMKRSAFPYLWTIASQVDIRSRDC
jgi:hypothetical protein